jgi:pyruvate formate lyase activating enzyme
MDVDDRPCVKEALLYQREGDGVRCNTCERLCLLTANQVGFCKTRRNFGGRIFTHIYGDISSFSANPVEKKPFFHFHPGSYAFTFGSWGCNFTCPWCQNYDISKQPPDPDKCSYVSPLNLIKLAKEERCQGISVSFNEPTLLLEYSLDVFDLARKEGLYNTYVTNGYMTLDALRLLVDHGLDAANFDVKGYGEMVSRYCGADVEKVWRNVAEARRLGVHVEITTLLIPEVNDGEECLRSIARRIGKDVGENTPWHVTQYHPAYKALEVGLYPERTPVEILERAWKVGRDEGLNYVYAGNVPGHQYENTYCPNCAELLIRRLGFKVIDYRVTPDGRCPKCGGDIQIVGEWSGR